MLRGGEPVSHEILTHAQAQTADDDEAKPPVIEDDGAWYDGLVIAVPVDDECQDQRRETDRLDDGNECIVAEIAHNGAVHAESNEERDCNNGSACEEPEMDSQRVVHIVYAKTDNKGKP